MLRATLPDNVLPVISTVVGVAEVTVQIAPPWLPAVLLDKSDAVIVRSPPAFEKMAPPFRLDELPVRLELVIVSVPRPDMKIAPPPIPDAVLFIRVMPVSVTV